MRAALLLTLASTLLACGGEGGPTSFGGMTQPGVTTVPAATGTSTTDTSSSGAPADSSTSTSTSTASSASSSTSEAPVWDMGVPDFGPQQPAGCAGKIDFLFAVSSNGTMTFSQKELVASLPGLMDAIEEKFSDFDYHILTANTDKSWVLEDCSVCTEGCDPQGELPYCSAAVTICDKKIGAGVIFPVGADASNRLCAIDGEQRYLTTGQQNLDEVFACTAQVGTAGSSITAEAMVAALQPAINDPEDPYACNRGFLRDDALLVVTLIDDGFDVDSLGTIEDWIEALRAAKNYDDDAFAVLVLTTDVDLGFHQLCHPTEATGTKNRLRLLTEQVAHGWTGSICMHSFVPFFAEHVDDLVELCDQFVPPG